MSNLASRLALTEHQSQEDVDEKVGCNKYYEQRGAPCRSQREHWVASRKVFGGCSGNQTGSYGIQIWLD